MQAAFEAALREFARQSLHAPGVTGVHLVGPVPGTSVDEYGIMRSFESAAASREFYSSPTYLEWEKLVSPMVDGPPIVRQLHGLEAFFREAGLQPPPRWKMAIVTWLGVFPTVWLWSRTIPGMLDGWHPIAVMAFVNVLVVVTLAWLIMPLLTKLFAGWLSSPAKTVQEQ
jgi:antibiotic biosynthesis monooxygenase (ABM) superfamily enzyme